MNPNLARQDIPAVPPDVIATTRAVLQQLRAAGGRVTVPRRAVIETLVEAGEEHITADELAARVRRRYPDVHRATVYRTLEKLQEAGVVAHVHLGHGPATFHLGTRPHHHVVCSVCGTMVELPVEALEPIAVHLRDEHGWKLAPQHFALTALCPNC